MRAAAAFRILCDLDTCGEIEVREDTSVMAYATIECRRGRSTLRFNRTDIESARKEFGEDASLGIFAHEMGHHLDWLRTPETDQAPWAREMRADRWAGCAIGTIDANPRPLEWFLRVRAADADATHPPGSVRAEEEIAGYEACHH